MSLNTRIKAFLHDGPAAQAAAPVYIPVLAKRPVPVISIPRKAEARFDIAVTTVDNRRHWWMADGLSIDAGANPQARFLMRTRSRYEYHNNSYLQGIVGTVGDYVIGTGPSLQMMVPGNKVLNKKIEKLWEDWSEEIGLTNILMTMRMARVYNGESLAAMHTNPDLCSPVKLDIREFECDRLTTPMLGAMPGQYADEFLDGIDVNDAGRPSIYHILRVHPGGTGFTLSLGYQTDPWPARYVMHDFRAARPEQYRGIPEVVAALNVFADIRRYSVAIVNAAENAANISQTIETPASAPVPERETYPKPFERVPLEHGMAVTMPEGYLLKQTKAEQPMTTYEMFINAKLQEAARCTGLPLMFVTMNPAGANMSASYIITQPFKKKIQFDREVIYKRHLNRIFREFVAEARLVPGLLPPGLPVDMPHVWRWPEIGEHADPKKVADGHTSDLANGITSIPGIIGGRGGDWEEVQENNAKSLGMSLIEYRAMLRQKMFSVSGNPAPASVDPEPTPVNPEEPDPDPSSLDDDE